MGAASQLKALYNQILGGSAPSGAASSSGDISQMIKYIVANPSTPNQKTIALARVAADIPAMSPIVGWCLDAYGNYKAIGVTAPASIGSPAITSDADNRRYIANVTGGVNGISWQPTPLALMNPMGMVASLPLTATSFDAYANQGFKTIPIIAPDTVVYEWYGGFPTAYAYNSSHGVGFSRSIVGPFWATPFSAGAYRGTSGWEVVTADGVAVSQQAEASDTSDASNHIFRLEYQAKATPVVRLYVDGVLKVTKTTNVSATYTSTAFQASSIIHAGNSTDASASSKWYCGFLYNKYVG